MKRFHRSTHLLVALAVLAVVMNVGVLFAPAPAAEAAQALSLSTPYPGVTVSPGQSLDVPITLANNGLASQPISVKVVKAPSGWKPDLRGGGYSVQQVYVKQGGTASLTMSASVPADVQPGTYQVVVQAQAGGASTQLTLNFTISKAATGSAKLTAQYPSLKGSASASFQYQLTLSNQYPQKQTFALGYKAPKGWSVTLKPEMSSKEVSSLAVNGNGSQTIQVTVSPPHDVKAGKYPIVVTANSSRSQVKSTLTAEITGSYNMKVTTQSGRLNATATAGQNSSLNFLVKNTGSSTVNNISLSSSAPPGWSVTFEPSSIGSLDPGKQKQVTAKIKPAKDAIAGDYQVTLNASSDNAYASQNFRVTVKTQTVWAWVGIVLILLVVGGVLYAFRVYGRR